MSAPSNKDIALAFIRRMEANDFDNALAMMSPDATFWSPAPGEMSVEKTREFFAPVGKMIKTMVFTLVGSTVEGERVALELQGVGTLFNGREYRNKYHFLFVIRDGKIAQVREYTDTAPAKVFFE